MFQTYNDSQNSDCSDVAGGSTAPMFTTTLKRSQRDRDGVAQLDHHRISVGDIPDTNWSHQCAALCWETRGVTDRRMLTMSCSNHYINIVFVDQYWQSVQTRARDEHKQEIDRPMDLGQTSSCGVLYEDYTQPFTPILTGN